MSSVFKHRLNAVPKSWIKGRGRKYAMPKEKLRDFGGLTPLSTRMVQMKLIRQHNKEHAILMAAVDIRPSRLDQWITRLQGKAPKQGGR